MGGNYHLLSYRKAKKPHVFNRLTKIFPVSRKEQDVYNLGHKGAVMEELTKRVGIKKYFVVVLETEHFLRKEQKCS